MAVPKRRSSKARQGNREACKRLDRLKTGLNKKAVLLKSDDSEKKSIKDMYIFKINHRADSENVYKGKVVKAKKIRKTKEENK